MTIHFTTNDLEVLVVDVAEKLKETNEGKRLTAVGLYELAHAAVNATLRPFIDTGAMVITEAPKPSPVGKISDDQKRSFIHGVRDGLDLDG